MPHPLNNITCSGCAYWEAGTCRYFPPTVLAANKVAWPITAATDWCGHATVLASGGAQAEALILSSPMEMNQ
jgi:hypothetical protein